jgi:phage repressor protein C with HTH and peptisase S24 domain
MFHPVVVHVAEDVRMYPLFSDGDLLLLDQARLSRTRIADDEIYVIKRGRVGLVRRLRKTGSGIYLVDAEGVTGERLPVEHHHITHFVRARGIFITRETEWR